MKNFLFKIRNRYFFLFDFIAFLIIPILVILMQADLTSHRVVIGNIFFYTLVFTLLKISVLFFMGMYRRYWDHASVDDLISIIISGAIIIIAQSMIFYLAQIVQVITSPGLGISFPILDAMFSMSWIGISRLSIRVVSSFNKTQLGISNGHEKKTNNILIIGAGQAGLTVLEELRGTSNTNSRVIGFIDDNNNKVGLTVRGVPILGNRNMIPSVVRDLQIDRIIIAMPSVAGVEIRKIHNICSGIGAELLTLPPIYEIIDGKVEIEKLRKIQIEDLLKREPVRTDTDEISKKLYNKTVLITGAGGSIGSEITKQVIACSPKRILLLGHGENSIFEISGEFRKRKEIEIEPIIADIKDKNRLKKIFSKNEIDIVFHAAAHKHVPLMEAHPSEAIENNILGTRNLINAAVENSIEHFVMISTDKAVNPTSVMGASKRTSEMIVIDAAKKYNKHYSVVRFGNVLDSRGSVVRVLKSQIARGGPLTITHPDIKRFFMTIPEAVQLVLQAFSLGKGGEIFVLDMGEPIKIIDLAKDLIKLSGLEIDKDIEIRFTGLRPGEKLFEELFINGENYKRTVHEKVFIAENASQFISPALHEIVCEMEARLSECEEYEIRDYLMTLIPAYKPMNLRSDYISASK